MTFVNSVVDYDSRGKWGSKDYPGNTTGYLVKDFAETYSPHTALDPMCGSCTSCEVFDELSIDHLHYDLIRGNDIASVTTRILMRRQVAEITDGNGIDMVFWHPPYWEMIRYNLNNPRDFSAGPYPSYLKRMGDTLQFLSGMLNVENPNTRIGVQLGDLRKRGKYYWLVHDVFTPSTLASSQLEVDAIVMRRQRGVTSGMRRYNTPYPLIRIMHEWFMILKPTQRHPGFGLDNANA